MRFLILFVLLLSGCIPAKVPPQLGATAGAPVVVTDRTLQFEGLEIEYPFSWRVITSAANNPRSFIFAAPEDKALIVLSTTEQIALPELTTTEEQETTYETVTKNNRQYHVWLISASSSHADFLPRFQNLLSSITR